MPTRPSRIPTRPELPPWRIEWHHELDSTMERARELALGGEPAGTVVVADFQRQGRGTHGRTWIAPRGTCLMFTFILRGHFDAASLAALPGRVAALTCETLVRDFRVCAEVKPPNDVMVGNRKLAGVLCLSQMAGEHSHWALCGLGLNTNLAAAQVTVDDSTSLQIETGERVHHVDLLERLLRSFDELREA